MREQNDTAPRQKAPAGRHGKFQRSLGWTLSLAMPSARSVGASGEEIGTTRWRGGARHPFTHSRNRRGLRIFLHCFGYPRGPCRLASVQPGAFGSGQAVEDRRCNRAMAGEYAFRLNEITPATRGGQIFRGHVRFLLLAALGSTRALPGFRRIVCAILLRKAPPITDGPEQEHYEGNRSHSMCTQAP